MEKIIEEVEKNKEETPKPRPAAFLRRTKLIRPDFLEELDKLS